MGVRWVYEGLDYQGVESVIRLCGHRGAKAREIFAGIQTMELAALEHLNDG